MAQSSLVPSRMALSRHSRIRTLPSSLPARPSTPRMRLRSYRQRSQNTVKGPATPRASPANKGKNFARSPEGLTPPGGSKESESACKYHLLSSATSATLPPDTSRDYNR